MGMGKDAREFELTYNISNYLSNIPRINGLPLNAVKYVSSGWAKHSVRGSYLPPKHPLLIFIHM